MPKMAKTMLHAPFFHHCENLHGCHLVDGWSSLPSLLGCMAGIVFSISLVICCRINFLVIQGFIGANLVHVGEAWDFEIGAHGV